MKILSFFFFLASNLETIVSSFIWMLKRGTSSWNMVGSKEIELNELMELMVQSLLGSFLMRNLLKWNKSIGIMGTVQWERSNGIVIGMELVPILILIGLNVVRIAIPVIYPTTVAPIKLQLIVSTSGDSLRLVHHH